jgi:hypothetical protein
MDPLPLVGRNPHEPRPGHARRTLPAREVLKEIRTGSKRRASDAFGEERRGEPMSGAGFQVAHVDPQGEAAGQQRIPLRHEVRLNARIGERVRARRHALGLTLKQVSGQSGLSVSLISQIELGRSAASVLSLHKLGCSLRVPMASFFEGL